LSPSPTHPCSFHPHLRPSPATVIPIPNRWLFPCRSPNGNSTLLRKTTSHDTSRFVFRNIMYHSCRGVASNFIMKWVTGVRSTDSMVRLFSNVRVSYITFTATAVLLQITKPLLRYYCGACPHTHKHSGVPQSTFNASPLPHYRHPRPHAAL